MCDTGTEKKKRSSDETVERIEETAVSEDTLSGKKEEPVTAKEAAAAVVVVVNVQKPLSDEKDVLEDEVVYKALQKMPFYHGFLPREDLGQLLKHDGDYLLRVSEVVTKKKEDGNTGIKRDIVLSACTPDRGGGQEPEQKDGKGGDATDRKLRNVVIRRYGGFFGIKASNAPFATIEALLANHHISNSAEPDRFLKTPIGLQNWEIQHSAVKLGEKLGEGAYGEVRKGMLQWKKRQCPVAVKLMKGSVAMNKEKIKEMMKEARLMRKFKHRNVVRFYGVALFEQPLYILLELVDGGALNEYLQKNKVNVFELMSMCLGAAQGLHYLHSNNCIHRDIAARNCLYSLDKVVKLSDFGLSREKNEYKLHTSQKMPIKWLAPETIRTLFFTPKTDVYSYGVMCWEIFSEGEEPWDGVRNTDVKHNVAHGIHLQLPEICPEKFRLFIYEKVYVVDPKQRVTMEDVVRFIEPIITDMQTTAVALMKTAELQRSERVIRPQFENIKSVIVPNISTGTRNSNQRNGSNSSRKSKSKVYKRKGAKKGGKKSAHPGNHQFEKQT